MGNASPTLKVGGGLKYSSEHFKTPYSPHSFKRRGVPDRKSCRGKQVTYNYCLRAKDSISWKNLFCQLKTSLTPLETQEQENNFEFKLFSQVSNGVDICFSRSLLLECEDFIAPVAFFVQAHDPFSKRRLSSLRAHCFSLCFNYPPLPPEP